MAVLQASTVGGGVGGRRGGVVVGVPSMEAEGVSNPLTKTPMGRAKRRVSMANSVAAAVLSKHHGEAAAKGPVVHLPPLTSFVVSTIVVLFVLHLSLVRASLSLLTCTSVGGRLF